MKVTLFLLSLIAPITTTTAFGIGRRAVHPQLQKFANDYLGRLVNLRLDIGKKVSGQQDRMSLQGPIVKFLGGKQNTKDLEVVKQGFVIDINGMQDVKFNEGHWEMTWREGDNDGRIICEFDLEEPVSHSKHLVELSLTASQESHPSLLWLCFDVTDSTQSRHDPRVSCPLGLSRMDQRVIGD